MDRLSRAAATTIAILLSMLTVEVAGAQTWYHGAWPYRRAVTLSNANGVALTDHQVLLSLDGTFDFTRAQSDGSDLRVTAGNGSTLLPFWIEAWDASAQRARIWVRVPALDTTGTTLYLYYGNPAAASAADGESAFDFFDDFDGNTAPGYFPLDTAQTIMLPDQAWETEAPHTLSVVRAPAGAEYPWYGYYGLEGCGGIGMAGSHDLVHWVKFAGNPLFTGDGERWPSVILVDDTYYMAHTIKFCNISGIVYRTSTDGLTWSAPSNLVPVTWGHRNQNPNLFRDPVSGYFYLNWHHSTEGAPQQILSRTSPTFGGLVNADARELLSSPGVLAAPNMMYRDGTYFLSTETYDTAWKVRIFSGSSPHGPFTLLPGNPVLSDGCACLFQTPVDTVLYEYYCKETAGVWTLDLRIGSLTAPRPPITAIDWARWTAIGGDWSARDTTQRDGTTGFVAHGSTSGRQFLASSFDGTDYVLEGYGRQGSGRMWGFGVRLSNVLNNYTLALYQDLDGGDNLFLYRWSGGASTPLWSGAVGVIDAGAWYKLTVKVHADSLAIYFDDSLMTATPVEGGGSASGHVALYGEAGTVAQYDGVWVRKYAAIEPSASIGPEVVLPAAGITPEPSRSQLALAPSQPNPFRGTTTLAFGLPRAASVGLAVFDIQGRMVRRLLEGPARAGWTRVTWDGRDDAGSALAPGAYVIRLLADGQVAARTTHLLR